MDEAIVAAAACPNPSLAFPRPFRMLAVTKGMRTVDQGRLMGEWTRARIQLCGRFAYLVLHRGRALPRDELLVAGWGEDVPAEALHAAG